MPRLQITPEEFKRAKLVKPGWYPTLIKDVAEELNKAKDGQNIVLEVELADNTSEFMGVPGKVWFTEKFPQGAVAFLKAMNPGLKEDAIVDVEFTDYRGMYVMAKWGTNRGKDGTDPPRNQIDDWAPLDKKWAHLKPQDMSAAAGVAGFGS
jgi:hypothetical protein